MLHPTKQLSALILFSLLFNNANGQTHQPKSTSSSKSAFDSSNSGLGSIAKRVEANAYLNDHVVLLAKLSWSEEQARSALLEALEDEYGVRFEGVRRDKNGYYGNLPKELTRDLLLNFYIYFNKFRSTRLELPLTVTLNPTAKDTSVDLSPNGIRVATPVNAFSLGEKFEAFLSTLDRELNTKLYTEYELRGQESKRVRDEFFGSYLKHRYDLQLTETSKSRWSSQELSALHKLLTSLPGHFFSSMDPVSPQLRHLELNKLPWAQLKKDDEIEDGKHSWFDPKSKTLRVRSELLSSFQIEKGKEHRATYNSPSYLPDEMILKALGETMWEGFSSDQQKAFASYSWAYNSKEKLFELKSGESLIFSHLNLAQPKDEFAALFSTYISRSELFVQQAASTPSHDPQAPHRAPTKLHFFMNEIFKGTFYERRVLNGIQQQIASLNEDDQPPKWTNGSLNVRLEESEDKTAYNLYFEITGVDDPKNSNGRPGSGLASIDFDLNLLSQFGGKFARPYIKEFRARLDTKNLDPKHPGTYRSTTPLTIPKSDLVAGLYMPVSLELRDAHGHTTHYTPRRDSLAAMAAKHLDSKTNSSYRQALESGSFYLPPEGVATTDGSNHLAAFFLGTQGEREKLIQDRLQKALSRDASLLPSPSEIPWDGLSVQRVSSDSDTLELVVPYDFSTHKDPLQFGFSVWLKHLETGRKVYFTTARKQFEAPATTATFPRGATRLRFYPGTQVPSGTYQVESFVALAPAEKNDGLDEQKIYRVPTDHVAQTTFTHKGSSLKDQTLALDWDKKEFYHVSVAENSVGGNTNLILSVPLQGELAESYKSNPESFDLSASFTVLDPQQRAKTYTVYGDPKLSPDKKTLYIDKKGTVWVQVVLPLPPQHRSGNYTGYNLSLRKQIEEKDSKEKALHEALGHEPLHPAADHWDYELDLTELIKTHELKAPPEQPKGVLE